jgi:hypothetical protein
VKDLIAKTAAPSTMAPLGGPKPLSLPAASASGGAGGASSLGPVSLAAPLRTGTAVPPPHPHSFHRCSVFTRGGDLADTVRKLWGAFARESGCGCWGRDRGKCIVFVGILVVGYKPPIHGSQGVLCRWEPVLALVPPTPLCSRGWTTLCLLISAHHFLPLCLLLLPRNPPAGKSDMAPLGAPSSLGGGLKPLGGGGGGSLGSLGPLGGSKPLGSMGSLALPSVLPQAAPAPGALISLGSAAGSPGASALSVKPVSWLPRLHASG